MLLKKKKDKKEKRQLGLNLKFSRLELFYKLKRASTRIEKNFVALPFWRNGLIWSTITAIVGITIITTVLIGKNYLDLPQQVPLIYDLLESKWKSYPKIFFFFVPLMLISFGIINIQFLQKVYYMNKNLALMICLVLTISYFLGLIAVNEILIICTS